MISWTDEDRQKIAGWLKEGLSSAVIARGLSQEKGCAISRNAVIGVIHRDKALKAIGHGATPTGATPRRAAAPAPARKEQRGALSPARILGKREGRAFDPGPKLPPVPSPAYDRDSLRLTLAAVPAGGCKFGVNDPAIGEDHLFCGLPARPGGPYCAHHAARAFTARAA